MARPARALLKDERPDLAEELVNKALLDTLSVGADRPVEWRCPVCHQTYFARPYNRTYAKHQTKCPICSGKIVVKGVNDVATTHPNCVKYFKNPEDAYTHTASSNDILTWICEHGHTWEAPVYRLTMAHNRCPYCSGRYPIVGVNDLGTTHPELAAELLDPTLATKLKAGTHKKVKWKCPEGHIYEAHVLNRTKCHSGCPVCNNRTIIHSNKSIIPYVNDLATTNPEIVPELVDPSDAIGISKGSEKRLRWKCKHGHTWFASPYNRIQRHSGCPVCKNRQIEVGFNDLATVRPDLVSELVNPEDAHHVTIGSRAKLEWRCEYGHTWFASVSDRTKKNPTGCPICANVGTSKKEQELVDIVQKLLPHDIIFTNDRTTLNGKELDIVIPRLSIAIEFNGTLWHSEARGGSKLDHLNKTKDALAAGYRLIHIWEDDWTTRQNVVIQSLAYKLHAINQLPTVLPDISPKAYQTVYARKLTPQEITNKEARDFLNENHIQGFVSETKIYALKDAEGNIRAVLGLRSPRHNARMNRKDGEWEIQRFATLGHIPGAFSKLLTYAEKQFKEQNIILNKWITFAAQDISDGNLYATCGFHIDKEIPPNYWYVGNRNRWIRETKETYQKRRFKEDPTLLWDDSWTEHKAALNNKLFRIWDAGKIRWVKNVR